MNKLVILAEKYNQAVAYTKAFNSVERRDGYFIVKGHYKAKEIIITYAIGHLVELYNPDDYDSEWKKWSMSTLPIFPNEYLFKISSSKSKQYKIVKNHLDSADKIIIGTDPDREGESIAHLIIRFSGNEHKPMKRLWVNSREVAEIEKALNDLRDTADYYPSYISAETRQIADWLVGINLSRLYTLQLNSIGIQETFSIGRVQTPTLNLIYQRNKTIDNFISNDFYEIEAEFKHDNGTYIGKFKQRFNSLSDLNEFIVTNLDQSDKQAIIKNVTSEKKNIHAPNLFSLSDLQSLANKKYKYSADKTLTIVQKLYENEILSYPRTDSNYIGTPEFDYLKKNLDRYLELINETIETPLLHENKRYVDSNKVKEHYAIIPTSTLPKLEKLDKDEKNIYLMVLYRTLAIFEKPYEYQETKIETVINQIVFFTSGKVKISDGWKRLISDTTEDQNKILPLVTINDLLPYQLITKNGKTTPPKYYTEGTLIVAMKNVSKDISDIENKGVLRKIEGIGTEATRASIIETLKKQQYIIIKNNVIHVTKKGNLLCSIIENDEIANVEMTATWEKYLKQIEESKGSQETFIKSIKNFISHVIDKVPNSMSNNQDRYNDEISSMQEESIIGTCPMCKQNIMNKGKFYGCTGYLEGCTFTIPRQWSSKTIPKKNVIELITKGITTEIKGFKSKKGNKFNARLKIDNNKLQFDFN